jgi:protein-L-isoaspartate(D-aspartate) O-methyltransferase
VTDRNRLHSAFDEVDRRDFLPASQRGFADEDTALRIGHGQTNSQPRTVWAMLDLLDVEAGNRVLDVGCGSGWTTALLGKLVGPRGTVTGVEIVPELVSWGRLNLASYDMTWTTIEQAEPDTLGLPQRAPFDRVLVSAEATTLPESLVSQLGPDGVLVVPVSGVMTVVRLSHGERRVSRAGHYSFVPLREPGPDT